MRARRWSPGTLESRAERQPAVEGLGRAGGVGVAVEQAQLLGGDPGRGDLAVGVAGAEPGQQPLPGAPGVVVVTRPRAGRSTRRMP